MVERGQDIKCTMCGYKKDQHEVDPLTGRQTKCPAPREKVASPAHEYNRSPRGDY